ncbi:MAG: hypothetical protein JXB36_08225 [Gammaproteobacteria bacterium]|nr:hypothetical protein [Gammaproteobacteria bacterium]
MSFAAASKITAGASAAARHAGRGLGALAGAAVAILWLAALWTPASGAMLAGIGFVVALLMALIGLFVVIASLRGHVVVLLIAFVASFFPIGFHLAAAEHWLSWVGRLNVAYLLAALLMWLGRRLDARD